MNWKEGLVLLSQIATIIGLLIAICSICKVKKEVAVVKMILTQQQSQKQDQNLNVAINIENKTS